MNTALANSNPKAFSAPADETSITVTIILTNYNHARYLDTSLGAIAGQTRAADEIIVVDDGSTDESVALIKKYAQRFPNIRLLENVTNQGVQFSISRALGATTSKWIVWAAADDRLQPDFLEKSVAAIARYPDVGITFSQLATFQDKTGEERHYTANGNPLSAFHIGNGVTHFDPAGLMSRLTSGYLWLSGNTSLIRLDRLLKISGFIPELEWHSDWLAFYSVALRYGAVGIPETLALIRVVPETYSSAGMKDPRRQGKVMRAVLETLRRPEFTDIRAKFRARPCLFSPFPKPMLKAMARRPQDWDLLLRFTCWALDHTSTQYRNRAAYARFPRGIRARVLGYATAIPHRVLIGLTPASWKTD